VEKVVHDFERKEFGSESKLKVQPLLHRDTGLHFFAFFRTVLRTRESGDGRDPV